MTSSHTPEGPGSASQPPSPCPGSPAGSLTRRGCALVAEEAPQEMLAALTAFLIP